jgi:hypothetical protein
MSETPHQRAEAELTRFALSLPETDVVPGWGKDDDRTRYMRVRKKGFGFFGEKGEADDTFSMTVKLPTAYEMIQHLYFVREGSEWYRRNKWAVVRFGPEDDVLAELDTLKDWLVQSYVAVAPKKLGAAVLETHGGRGGG